MPTKEQRLEEIRVVAEVLADRLLARARVWSKCGDLDGAEAFLEEARAFLARPLARFRSSTTMEG